MKGISLALGGVAALALVSRSRGASQGSAARRPLDYDALADDFREFYATLGWAVDEERELRRWAWGHGVTYLGAGAQRAVFGVPAQGARPGGALKIAFDRDGKDANCREAEVWEDAPADIRRYLVPVLENSGTEPGEGAWVLMERVRCSARGKLPEEAAERLSACGFNDIVGQNISDDGRLLDYGWMYMDEWAPCATPGSYTSNRPAVGGSAARRGNLLVPAASTGHSFLAYHGTSANFTKFDPKKSAQGILWFSTDREKIARGDAGAAGRDRILTVRVTLENPAGWDEYDRLSLWELRREGYDGAILRDHPGEEHFDGFVFRAAQIQIVKGVP